MTYAIERTPDDFVCLRLCACACVCVCVCVCVITFLYILLFWGMLNIILELNLYLENFISSQFISNILHTKRGVLHKQNQC